MDKAILFFKKNWLLVLTIIYILLPVDLVPDLIPVLGKLDDTTMLILQLVKSFLDSKKSDEKN